MTLQLQLGGIKDPDVRHALETIAQAFPIQALNTASDVPIFTGTSTNHPKISWGLIRGSDGVKLAGSTDYASSRTGTGQYDITWTTAKAGTAYMILLGSEDGPGVNVPDYNAKVAASFHVQTFATNTGSLTDSTDWGFVVIDAQG